MKARAKDIWIPGPGDVADANVTELANLLGLSDFDALYAFSIREPAAYWAAVNRYCGIRWSKDYDIYCDDSRGKALPSWFVGGELNWVDTVLARADDEAGAARLAVVAERENGAVGTASYAELRDEVRGMAAGLLDIGVRRGDRIGLLMENGREATTAMLALAYMGAIAVPLFSGFGVDPIVSRLRVCAARGLLATSGFLRRGKAVDVRPILSQVRAQLPGLDIVVVKDSPEIPPHRDVGAAGPLWRELFKDPSSALPSCRMSPDDPFMIVFTSGTTGRPKGAVHTHGGFPLKIAHDAAVHFNVKAGDVFCWPADMGWIAGSLVLASALMRGATLVCYDGAPDYPDWSRMGRLIERYRVTHYGSAPTLIRGLAENERTSTLGDRSSIKLLITAGETIAPEHFRWFQRHFGRGECPLINYTGGTEVSGGLLSSVVVKPIVPAGFNTRSPGVAADVVDASGTPVTGRIGELAVLEPFVGMTKAFWQDEQRYLETYWEIVEGMWIHGDLALKDDDGNYFLMGRSDDTIKIAGKRVGPAEMEDIVATLEGVGEVAVIGVEDAAKGQAIVVFVTAPGIGDPDALTRTVGESIRRRLGKAFAPREVLVVPQLPKTRSSKTMRRIIRGIYDGKPLGDLSSLLNPESIGQIESLLRGR